MSWCAQGSREDPRSQALVSSVGNASRSLVCGYYCTNLPFLASSQIHYISSQLPSSLELNLLSLGSTVLFKMSTLSVLRQRTAPAMRSMARASGSVGIRRLATSALTHRVSSSVAKPASRLAVANSDQSRFFATFERKKPHINIGTIGHVSTKDTVELTALPP